jgi:hypothetical protein
MSNAVDFLIWNILVNHYPEALTLADYTKLLVSAVFLTWGYAGFLYGTVALAHPYGSKAYPYSYTMSVDVPGKAPQLRADMAKTLIFHRETDGAIKRFNLQIIIGQGGYLVTRPPSSNCEDM